MWLDKQELLPGDSLRGKIDEGLARSSCGVVILSEDFFAKRWPQQELSGLFALLGTGTRIIPIWHGLSADRVARFSPLLADRFALQSAAGIPSLSRTITATILKDPSTPANVSPNARRRFAEMLATASAEEMVDRIDAGPRLLRKLMSHHPDHVERVDAFAGVPVGLAASSHLSTAGILSWHLLFLRSPQSGASGGRDAAARDVAAAVADVARVQNAVRSDLIAARRRFPDISLSFPSTILLGRREHYSSFRDIVVEALQYKQQISLRTYDALAEGLED